MSKDLEEARVPRMVPLAQLGTTLGRVRCPQPTQLTRMRQSLSTHGQITAAIAVNRDGKLELVDGFKRRAAAAQMGWEELLVTVRQLDERAQWATMLALSRTSGALSVLEEALILRELCQSGLTQAELAQLVGRHKSWVSRRLGLVERLHPDLVQWVRTGLMPPGTARRLMMLPAGNQLELAAVVNQAALSTEETEILVSLWQKANDPTIRRFLLKEPRTALQNASPEKCQAPLDPRLSSRGKVLARALPLLRGVALRVTEALHPTPEPSDLKLLAAEMRRTQSILPGLERALGSASKCASSDDSGATSAMRRSGG
ncbi:MAG TPA: ParB N-terminal domain-containing protein [Burkholderiales bacterium]|nr:ParB N-terminal domain-containing protein [Burkholderiales bacterium]